MLFRAAMAALGSLVVLAAATAVRAQDYPGHPRVNEIDQRLRNQQNRTDAGVAQGQIGAGGAAADSARDARVSRQLSRDEAAHNGHISLGEQWQMNRELNRNSADIYAQRHR